MKKNINNTEAIKHPEQRAGEVFLINVIDGETWVCRIFAHPQE